MSSSRLTFSAGSGSTLLLTRPVERRRVPRMPACSTDMVVLSAAFTLMDAPLRRAVLRLRRAG